MVTDDLYVDERPCTPSESPYNKAISRKTAEALFFPLPFKNRAKRVKVNPGCLRLEPWARSCWASRLKGKRGSKQVGKVG